MVYYITVLWWVPYHGMFRGLILSSGLVWAILDNLPD